MGRDLRYADLKQVVLDKLLAEHCNAKLDTQLHEAACMGTLQGGGGGGGSAQNSTLNVGEKTKNKHLHQKISAF